MSSGAAMRAGALLRRFATATIVLGLFAGVAGGVALGAWGMARRTATSYDRFVEYAHTSELTVFACPEGIVEYGPQACGSFDYQDIAMFLRSLPQVEGVGRYTMAISGVAQARRDASHRVAPGAGWGQQHPADASLRPVERATAGARSHPTQHTGGATCASSARSPRSRGSRRKRSRG